MKTFDNPSDGVVGTLRDWCSEQFLPWEYLRLDRSEVSQKMQYLNDVEPNTFVFDIKGTAVSVLEKPRSIQHSSFNESFLRAEIYRDYIEQTLKRADLPFDMRFAFYVGDAAWHGSDFPIFAFQRLIGNNSPLLPDIGLASPVYRHTPDDPFTYEEKKPLGVFVGSTSGGIVTVDNIVHQRIPRIRAEAFFRPNPEVTFLLPVITQYDSAEALALLQSMGLGDGRKMTWDEQFAYRFNLSIDGNGPSGSRIVIGLKSNSVLIQYGSPHELFFSRGLQAWKHYVPVAVDADVLPIIRQELRTPGRFKPIAEAGTAFHDRFLTEPAVETYTLLLLKQYQRLFPTAD